MSISNRYFSNTYNFPCKHYAMLGWRSAFQFSLYVFRMLNSYLLCIKQRGFQKAQTTELAFETGLITVNFL